MYQLPSQGVLCINKLLNLIIYNNLIKYHVTFVANHEHFENILELYTSI